MNIRLARTSLGLTAAAALAATVLSAPAGADTSSGAAAAQDAYVGSLQARHDAARPWTQMDDYVRVLEYWHQHPDWGIRS